MTSPLELECPACGAPAPVSALPDVAITCSFCGATLVARSKVEHGPPKAPSHAPAATPASLTPAPRTPEPIPARAALIRARRIDAVLLLAAGVLLGRSLVIAREPMLMGTVPHAVMVGVLSIVFGLRNLPLFGAVLTAISGALLTVKPWAWPIRSYDSHIFSPTSETGLFYLVPGALLCLAGVVLVAQRGRPEARRVTLDRFWPLAACAVPVGIVIGLRSVPDRVVRDRVTSAAPAPATPRELVVDWAGTKGEIVGGGRVEVSGYGDGLFITLEGTGEGGTWSLGPKRGRTESTLTLIRQPVLELLGARTWRELEAFVYPHALHLSLRDGRSGATPVPAVNLNYTVGELLRAAENGPVLFGQEPADPHPHDSLYWPGGTKRHIGRAGRLQELDYVLLTHPQPAIMGRRLCPGERTAKGEREPDVTLLLRQTRAVIYDRRTGASVHQQVFDPSNNCPLVRFGGSNREQDSYPPFQAIEAWARTLVRS